MQAGISHFLFFFIVRIVMSLPPESGAEGAYAQRKQCRRDL
jgi:hypothetical protein